MNIQHTSSHPQNSIELSTLPAKKINDPQKAETTEKVKGVAPQCLTEIQALEKGDPVNSIVFPVAGLDDIVKLCTNLLKTNKDFLLSQIPPFILVDYADLFFVDEEVPALPLTDSKCVIS